ncbi:MAG TPA: hypothetical protein VMW19_19490 [Myxococcota bacterium]|nr:hypothetical protein [Myxococcota bacterium]
MPGFHRAMQRILPLAALAAAVALAHGEIFRAGAAEVAPLAPEGQVVWPRQSAVGDVIFEAWLVARHARTLVTRPWRLWDTEHCAPEQHTLAYGVPLIGLGLLAVPTAIFSSEPVFVYNAALAAWSTVAALAMYALVTGWTGRRAAGLAAALLFAFHPIRLDHILHPAEWDIAPTAFALFFAERLFAMGRWRDVLGLGASIALQIATSFYTLLAATLLALPLGLWLLFRRAPRRVTVAQLAAVLAVVALAAAFVLGPYLEARDLGELPQRTEFLFATPATWLPGGPLFLGLPLLVAAAVGLAMPRRLALARVEGDPRPALLGAALLLAFVAAGPSTAESLSSIGLPVPLFDPYASLARALPGLDTVRVVMRLGSGVHLVACVLAGTGLAAAIAASGRYGGPVVSLVGVAAAALVCFGAPIPQPLRWELERIRPDQASIDFFRALRAQGLTGPLLEVPLDFVDQDWTDVGPRRILLSAWHGQRTSACYGSFRPRLRSELAEKSAKLPWRWAVDAIRELGFRAVIVHDPGAWWDLQARFAPPGWSEQDLRLERESKTLRAYEILPGATHQAASEDP